MRWLTALLLLPSWSLAANPAPVLLGKFERLDPAFDQLVAENAQVEQLADGFRWSEGPVWFHGAMLFSDVPENVIYRWAQGEPRAQVFLKPSGMLTPQEGIREQGSNGLALDAQGRLLMCQHGERRIARLERDGKQTPLAERFEGKRFNSPNDLVVAKNGDIYFTDPPYGLKDPSLRELPHNGVYRLTQDGRVALLTDALSFPNGIALAPDEKTLYVAVSDSKNPVIMAYGILADGTLSEGRVLFDTRSLVSPERKGLPDGLKVDEKGHLFATGPGGVLVLSPEGKHLGSILTGQATANCAWGDDGSTLYLTTHMFFARVKTRTRGAGFGGEEKRP
jgi:gluconolactonase